MKKWFLFSLLLLTAAVLVECSSHSRKVKTSDSPEEVFGRLQSFTDRGGSDVDGISLRSLNIEESNKFADLAFDDGSVVYYARAPGTFGRVRNVVAIRDFSSLGFNLTAHDEITDAEVFFADNPKHQPRNGLLVAVKKKGSTSFDVKFFMSISQAHLDKARFDVTLSDEDKTSPHVIHIQSIDVDSAHNLRGVIQLKVFAADGKYVGRFPTLAGYAQ